MTDMQPGQLIVPHDEGKPADGVPPAQTTTPQPAVVAPTPPAPAAAPQSLTPASQPQQSATEQPVAAAAVPATAEEPADSLYNPRDDHSADAALPQPEEEDVMWTAAEFVDNHKGIKWYLSLFGVGAVTSAIAFFLLKDIFSTIIIALAVIAFAVYAARKPREQQYHLNTFGVQVGTKVYEFHDFKAFSITHDDNVVSVALRPLKRFMPAPTLYVIPEVADRVIELLSMVMPAEQHRSDAIDSLMRKIRF